MGLVLLPEPFGWGGMMARKNRFKESQDKREGGRFIALPHVVIRSHSCSLLSPYAIKLLIDLLTQYNGDNNGDFCAAWTLMKPRGWKSKETLSKAIKELINAGWIELTRQGGMNKSNLYAVTFYAIDECKGKLDVQATRTPRGTWKQNEPLPPMPKLKVVPRLAGQLPDDCPASRINLEVATC